MPAQSATAFLRQRKASAHRSCASCRKRDRSNDGRMRRRAAVRESDGARQQSRKSGKRKNDAGRGGIFPAASRFRCIESFRILLEQTPCGGAGPGRYYSCPVYIFGRGGHKSLRDAGERKPATPSRLFCEWYKFRLKSDILYGIINKNTISGAAHPSRGRVSALGEGRE